MVKLVDFVDMHIELMNKVSNGNPAYWQWFKAMAVHFGPKDIDKVQSRKIQKRFDSRIKECYKNAWLVHLIKPEYKYFVGWVNGLIPIEHAWLVKDGKVVDPTLAVNHNGDAERFGSEYFGVEVVQFSKSELKIPEAFDLFKQEILNKKKKEVKNE